MSAELAGEPQHCPPPEGLSQSGSRAAPAIDPKSRGAEARNFWMVQSLRAADTWGRPHSAAALSKSRSSRAFFSFGRLERKAGPKLNAMSTRASCAGDGRSIEAG